MKQVAVITGAAGGMGMAIARLLGRTQRLLLTDINEARLDALLVTLADEGYDAEGLAGDLVDPEVALALAERCAKAGALRSIVNTAGLSPVQADWQAIMNANIVGPVRLLNALEPLLVTGAACVMIASVAGHLGPQDDEAMKLLDDPLQADFFDVLEQKLAALAAADDGSMEGHAYSLSKRAIIRLCERRAIDWGKKGARIASISPGVIWTPMGRTEAESGDRAQALVDAAPAGRWGTPMDIATTAEFLLSDAASFITGSDIKVDGGVVAALQDMAF